MCTSLTFNRQIISLPRISFIYNACDNYYYDDKTKSIIGNCYDNNGVSIISSIFLPSIITFDINNKITWKSKSDTVIENSISFTTIQIVNGIYNFKEEIENMCKVTQKRIGEKNVMFKLNIADDIPYELIGDKGKVKEIVNNLSKYYGTYDTTDKTIDIKK